MISRRTILQKPHRKSTEALQLASHLVTHEVVAVLALPPSFIDYVGIVPVETLNSKVTGLAHDYCNDLMFLSLRNLASFRTYSQAMRAKVEGHSTGIKPIDIESTLRVLMAVPAAQELESLGRSIQGLNPDDPAAKEELELLKTRARRLIFGKFT